MLSDTELTEMVERAAQSLEALPDHAEHYALAEAVSRLVPEVRRLRGLIKDAEWNGTFGCHSTADLPQCPWCFELQEDGGTHEPTCPAFGSPNGQ
jgi:hypothetical protein